ncbi:hypothetical protein SUGI_0912500 [Cryptomeria japonica]|nr:hypothetical protein SUGI_0912500 [Cryptomeria japonica]
MLGDLVVTWVYAKQSVNTEMAPVPSQPRGILLIFILIPLCTFNFPASDHVAPLPISASVGDSLLLIVALCFHSVFEGIAIGVAETEADAWRALWTVCLHKIFAAIAMGIALLQIVPNRPFFCFFHILPNWDCNRHNNRFHYRGTSCRLDLCDFNGFGLWSLHLRGNKPSSQSMDQTPYLSICSLRSN